MSGIIRPKAVLFDLYRTLIDITTDEYRAELWENLARYLRYRGLSVYPERLRETFFTTTHLQIQESSQRSPEVDVEGVFRSILHSLGYRGEDNDLPLLTTQLFRSLSIVKFGLYQDTMRTLNALHGRYKLGLVTNAQRAFAVPELEMTALMPIWDVIVISSQYGFCKPDPRLFLIALEGLKVRASDSVYIGDSVASDVCGANNAGMRSILLLRDPGQECHAEISADWTINNLDELRNML